MERRLAAILAADVVGYSRLMAQDERGTLESLRAALDAVVSPAVGDHGGRIFKTTGDGFLATFTSVSQAVDAAIAIQAGFARQPLQLRIGVNLGDVIEEGGDVFGDGVNLAARLEAMAEPGGVLVSEPVVRSVAGKPGVAFERLGARRGKNLPAPVEVYAVRWGDALAGRSRARGRRRRLAALAAGVALVLVAGAVWSERETLVSALSGLAGAEPAPAAEMGSATGQPAVAVLPFDNLSGDPAQDYFSDGLTEDIINDLARNDDLLVIARNSTFAYRAQAVDVREVGRALNAGYVVEGSARRAGDRLRVVAQLIDARSGAHLWSQSYDRRIEDVLTVQADLTTHISAALLSYVRQSEVAAVQARPLGSMRAYDLVLRGRSRYDGGKLDPDALLAARELFARAVAVDPSYAAAHAYLGLTYIVDQMNAVTDTRDRRSLATGLDHIRTALRLEPDLPLAFRTLSFGLAESGDFEGAMRAAGRAVELNASDPDSLMSLAKAQVRFGAYGEAVANAELARRLHPFAPQYYPYVHGQALYAAGRAADAVDVLADCLVRAPEERNCLRMQAAVLARLGRTEEARELMARLTALDPRFSIAQERTSARFGASPLMETYLADLAAAGAPAMAGQARAPGAESTRGRVSL